MSYPQNIFLQVNSLLGVIGQLECVNHRVLCDILGGNLISGLKFKASSILLMFLTVVALLDDQLLEMLTQHSVGSKCFIVKPWTC